MSKAKARNICNDPSCINFQRYCRLHQGYVVPEVKEISKVSDNQKEILKKYKPIRAKYLREHPLCEAKIDGCKVVAEEIHHKAGKVGEDLYLNPDYYLACCRSCHSIIEKNPTWAKQNGYSVSRLSKELKNKRA